MIRYLRRRGLLRGEGALVEEERHGAGLAERTATAASGTSPPAGPEWRRGVLPLAPRALAFEGRLCASLDGFTLHAATRAGGLDEPGREALLKYILRPAVAQERISQGPVGVIRMT